MSGLPFRSLTGDRAFRRLRKGRTGGARHLGIRWRPTRDGVVRVGIVVSRKVGNAVVRNRVRRRLREALLALLRELPFESGSFDLIVLTRPEAATADFHTLKASLERALRRGGLL